MKTPLVSVVMATFNEPVKYIRASIESILEQTYKNIELIIIDDSTNQETKNAIDSYNKDSRVFILRESERIGFVKALNRGLSIAKGEYIARMDGDDVSNKERIFSQVEHLLRNKKVDILGTAMNIIDEEGNPVSQRFYPLNNNKLLLWSILRNPFAHPTVMFRRDIIEQGLFYNESFSKSEDLELWLRLRNYDFKFANLPNILLNYRVVGDLATKRTKENFKFNLKARIKNISFRYLFLDLLSIVVAKTYCICPQSLFSLAYARENKISQRKN